MTETAKASPQKYGRFIAVTMVAITLAPGGYVVQANAADVVSAPSLNTTDRDESIRPFQVHVPQSQLDDLRGVLQRRAGPTRKPLVTRPKVFNWRKSRNWSATGEPITTGARPRRNSMRCRNSSRSCNGR